MTAMTAMATPSGRLQLSAFGIKRQICRLFLRRPLSRLQAIILASDLLNGTVFLERMLEAHAMVQDRAKERIAEPTVHGHENRR